jgi:RNA polymerase sigma factor (sigma-70 family)
MTQAVESSNQSDIARQELLEKLYGEHFDFLVAVAVRKFRIPDSDAEDLAHRVILMYVERSRDVVNVHSWLLGATCHASRYYWRQNERATEPLDDDVFERADPATTRILDTLPDQLAAREALEGLSARDQEILTMRYFEGCTIVEIAARLGVKPKYAQMLLNKVLRRAQRKYSGLSKRTPESARDALAEFVDTYRKVG